MTDPLAPLLFLGHGSPAVALEAEDDYTRAARRAGEALGTPRAFVVVSAHWQTRGAVRATSSPSPPLVYDFYGFPRALYELTYPCPGSPSLAAEIVSLLADGGRPAASEPARGLDHGVWIPLRFLRPAADVPVVQVSLPAGAAPRDLLDVGLALAPLRLRGVVLVGSGNVVHNIASVRFDDKRAPVDPWAKEFDDWARAALIDGDAEALLRYREDAPASARAAPTSEHLDPLFVVLGAASPADRLTWIFEGFHHGNVAMRSFALSPGEA